MSDYKIIIVLSRHKISFEYILKGQTVPSHMPKGVWPAPLAFFASSKGLVVGNEAARAAKSGTQNAFDDYFGLIRTTTTYTHAGKTEPIRKIFLDGAEAIFEDFFQSVLFNSAGQLYENRDKMPLYIVCEADVKDEERIHIQKLFADAGYKHVQATYMNDSLAELSKEVFYRAYSTPFMLTVWAEGFDLSLALFDAQCGKTLACNLVPNLGRDPRIEQVYSNIWAQVKSINPWLEDKSEKAQLMGIATEFMNSTKHTENRSVVLSDGYPYHIQLDRPKMLDSDESKLLRSKLLEIMALHSASRADTILALRGIAATNEFFCGNIGDGWRVVNRTNIDLRNEALRLLLLSTVTPLDDGSDRQQELAELKKRWQKIKTEASGLENAKKFDEAIRMLSTFKTEIPSDDTIFADLLKEVITVANSMQTLAELLKRWQKVKTAALGLGNAKKFDEAIHMLSTFKTEIPSGDSFADMLKEVNEAINLAISVQTLAELLKRWRKIKAEALGLGRTKKFDEAIRMLSTFKAEIPSGETFAHLLKEVNEAITEIQLDKSKSEPGRTPTDPEIHGPIASPEPDDKQLKELMRKKKVCVAQADGKARAKLYDEAVRLCKEFIQTISDEAAFEPIREEIKAKIAEYQRNIDAQRPVKTQKPKVDTPTPTPPTVRIITGGQPPKPPTPVGDGYRLIKEGKLRDARDWFKERNQNDVVAKLSKLIRAQKSIIMYRTKELPALKAKPDKARVATILNEVVMYISAAKELGFIDSDASSLFKELQKLK